MPPLRILYVSTSTTVGGAEKTLYTLATLVDPARFKVAGVVSLKPRGHYARALEAAGHKVFSLELKDSPRLDTVQRLAAVVAETSPQLVHAVMYQAIQLARAVKRLGYAEYALVSSPRVNYRTRSGLTLWVDRLLRGVDDLLVTESDASRAYLQEKLGYPAGKLATIYNGVDLAGWPVSKTERNRLRLELRIGADDVLLGSVGRLDEQKGHAYLLEATAKLRAVHPVRCVLIGDGPLKPRLAELARKLRIEECVHFAGEQRDLPAWLSALDVFVLPSLWEGLPNALLEAMAVGLPVVATRVDGVGEAVQQDVNGLLCEPKDSQALFVPLQDLVLDPALRRRLGKTAQESIAARFKLSDMIAAYEAAYVRAAKAAS